MRGAAHAAGVVVEFHVPTFVTAAYIVSEPDGFAVNDGSSGFLLLWIRLIGSG